MKPGENISRNSAADVFVRERDRQLSGAVVIAGNKNSMTTARAFSERFRRRSSEFDLKSGDVAFGDSGTQRD